MHTFDSSGKKERVNYSHLHCFFNENLETFKLERTVKQIRKFWALVENNWWSLFKKRRREYALFWGEKKIEEKLLHLRRKLLFASQKIMEMHVSIKLIPQNTPKTNEKPRNSPKIPLHPKKSRKPPRNFPKKLHSL